MVIIMFVMLGAIVASAGTSAGARRIRCPITTNSCARTKPAPPDRCLTLPDPMTFAILMESLGIAPNASAARLRHRQHAGDAALVHAPALRRLGLVLRLHALALPRKQEPQGELRRHDQPSADQARGRRPRAGSRPAPGLRRADLGRRASTSSPPGPTSPTCARSASSSSGISSTPAPTASSASATSSSSPPPIRSASIARTPTPRTTSTAINEMHLPVNKPVHRRRHVQGRHPRFLHPQHARGAGRDSRLDHPALVHARSRRHLRDRLRAALRQQPFR